MSETYSPDPGTDLQPPYTTAFFSQRDLGLRVPINYVTAPGVSFTTACFAHNRFEDDSSGQCLSNLLAVGFRRFEIDLYWDQGRSVWSFCPVAISNFVLSPESSSRNPSSLSSSALRPSNSALSSLSISRPTIAARATTETSPGLPATSTTQSPTTAGRTSLGKTVPTIQSPPDTSNQPLVSVGPYVCTATINLSTFTSQLLDYIKETETFLGAHLLSVVLNIHAVSSNNVPTSPALTPGNLPEPSDLLSNIFSANLSAYMYTPTNLMSDRTNLNESWYRDTVAPQFRPVADYYSVDFTEFGIASTKDGWPSESFVEFSRGKRLLLGWGMVDPQMAGYDFSGDSGTIFPNGYIRANQTDIDASSDGVITRGCFLRNQAPDLSSVNSSWATETNLASFSYPVTSASNLVPLLNLTRNTTNCGISPFLNVTLLNSTANDNYVPYQNYSYAASLWSWALGEPRNYSTSQDASSNGLFQCATTNLDLSGRWTVADCSSKYYAACRAYGKPHNWTITTYAVSYSFGGDACPNAYEFAAPRTALENSYLTQAMRSSRRDHDGHGVWVDFNSLDVGGCWTTGGANATCPYMDDVTVTDEIRKRVILIPTVAAFIVLLVTILTILSKAVGNHRILRRTRKRASNGFVYEGVPS